MRILILDPSYPEFLSSFYAEHPHAASLPYLEQWRALMDQYLGAADFYSANLNALGHEATEIIFNCEQLQRQWAKEHGIKLAKWTPIRRRGWVPWLRRIEANDWTYTVLKAQVEQYRPDVLYVHDMNNISVAFLREVRSSVRLIVGQIACAIEPGADFSEYDLVISSLPHYVKSFREQGLDSQFLRLGFGRSVLEKIDKQTHRYPVTHVGGYGPVHRERNELLESVITSGAPLTCWGYGVDFLAANSPIRRVYQGEAWGLKMYNIRANSHIVVSRHVSSVASVHANLMTLYEATGVGTLLLIDDRDDLQSVFNCGQEVVVYRSAEECAELITYYLEHDEQRERIALAGQARTLREHTYFHRMQELVDFLKPYL